MNKISDFKDTMKMLKELQSNIGNMGDVDISNPQKMLNSLGVDIDQVEKSFTNSFKQKIRLEYVLDSTNQEPEYVYSTDSGFDLRSNEDVIVEPLGRSLIPTGLYLNVPEKYEVQVRPKSGLAIKRGLSVLNTPGTVDNGYTGEIKVIVFNMSNETQTIHKGDKIAQAVVCPVVQGGDIELSRVENIKEKDRNENGFGSTGN